MKLEKSILLLPPRALCEDDIWKIGFFVILVARIFWYSGLQQPQPAAGQPPHQTSKCWKKSLKLFSKFFCNCRKQYLHSLANMFDIFSAAAARRQICRKWRQLFTSAAFWKTATSSPVFYKRTMSKIRQLDQALVQKLVSLRLSLKRVLPTNNLRCLPIEAKWEVGNFDCLINENLTETFSI